MCIMFECWIGWVGEGGGGWVFERLSACLEACNAVVCLLWEQNTRIPGKDTPSKMSSIQWFFDSTQNKKKSPGCSANYWEAIIIPKQYAKRIKMVTPKFAKIYRTICPLPESYILHTQSSLLPNFSMTFNETFSHALTHPSSLLSVSKKHNLPPL